MSRWKAAIIHLALSLLVIGSLAGYVLLLWYPPALLPLSGVDRLIGLIAAVDVTVGPLLTLIVYRHGKPGLRLDLTLIAAMQLGLFAYGLHVLAQNRPIFIVGVVDRLELVAARDVSDADLKLAPPEYQSRSWTGAMLVGAPLPTDLAVRSQLLSDAAEGRDIHAQPYYYKPFSQVQGELLLHANPLPALLELASPAERDKVLAALPARDAEDIRYLPLHSHGANALALIDKSGAIVAFAPVDPRDIEPRATTDG